ncbi:glycosyltransferase [Halotia wernerae UHCC 0503]|nr:glycosyltransferase [Halotia wernerae UHCC 0503]
MEKIANDTLSLWREEGNRVIPQNFEVFRSLVAQAKEFADHSKYDAAAVYGEMAAFYAAWKHCGLFVSLELEQVLLNIGKKVIPTYSSFRNSNSLLQKPNKILHIATTVQAIGGHSKMLWRWIQEDNDHCHSLVLTRQSRIDNVPKPLREAVNNSGGKIYKLNETIGSIISWAKRLREIAAETDLVVLHIHNYDVIPIIAFANKEQSPPVVLLDHADHVFWVGAGISDVVANLRESGMHLAQKRRGIEAERNVLLPTILEPIHRLLNRTEAKQKLGLAEDSVVLLSIARALKYKTISGISYADAHVQLLKKYEKATLLVVGAGNREDWAAAIQQTQGRIIVQPEREDTAIFYQAADIYVDSFPFISTTSLLEAGSYGVPLVSRFPYSDASSIFGAVMPGLTDNLIVARNLEEYTSVLSRLVEDEEFRLSQGEVTRKKIVEMHWGSNWQQYLENLYMRAATLPPIKAPLVPIDQMFLDEPHIFVPSVYGGNDFDLDYLIQSNLAVMPLEQRLHHWFKLVKKHGFHNHFGRFGQFRLLVPEWLYCRYVRLRYG